MEIIKYFLSCKLCHFKNENISPMILIAFNIRRIGEIFKIMKLNSYLKCKVHKSIKHSVWERRNLFLTPLLVE